MANTNEILLNWAGMSVDQFRSKLMGPESVTLEALFGPEELNELRGIAATAPLTRSANLRPRVVLIPGLMGSTLQSVQGIVELLWVNPLVFTGGQINLLELAADGEGDAHPRIRIVATGLEMISYASASLMLGTQARLCLFPYDWRQDVRVSAQQLQRALLRWSMDDDGRRFTLVGHSLGGVVSRTYLAMFPGEAERLVERVVLLGSPVYGAAEAVMGLISGNALTELADRLSSGNDAMRVVRSCTAVYQVLPPPPEFFPAGEAYPCDFELYDAEAWQTEGIRPDVLVRARELYELLTASNPQMPIIQIAGYDRPTLVAVRGKPGALQPVVISQGPNSGDGTVPLWSVTMPGADMYYVRLAHDRLQKDRRVLQAILDLAHGGNADLPREMEQDRTRPVEASPLVGEVDVDAQAQRLRTAIEGGTATADDLRRLFMLQL